MTEKEIIFEKIRNLWKKAEIQDMKNGGYRGNYEFEIGERIYDILISEDPWNVVVKKPTLTMFLLGIPVRINYYNPDVLKLWVEVEE